MADLTLSGVETAYTRSVLLAVELLDAVTLEPVTRTVQLSAPPLAPPPFLNAGGRFIWLLSGPLRPLRVIVEPGTLPYDREDIAAPPLPAILLPATDRLLRIWLRPRRGYRFADGVTLVRGRLLESAAPGAAPVLDAELWLEWQDDASAWRELSARTFTRSASGGEFTAFLRLTAPDQIPHDSKGALELRIGARRPGLGIRHSPQFTLRQGVQHDLAGALAWADMT
ncbi:MAG: hypothetical protein ABIT83_24530 [Massilia sp.]